VAESRADAARRPERHRGPRIPRGHPLLQVPRPRHVRLRRRAPDLRGGRNHARRHGQQADAYPRPRREAEPRPLRHAERETPRGAAHLVARPEALARELPLPRCQARHHDLAGRRPPGDQARGRRVGAREARHA
jgi:hypothetical protein